MLPLCICCELGTQGFMLHLWCVQRWDGKVSLWLIAKLQCAVHHKENTSVESHWKWKWCFDNSLMCFVSFILLRFSDTQLNCSHIWVPGLVIIWLDSNVYSAQIHSFQYVDFTGRRGGADQGQHFFGCTQFRQCTVNFIIDQFFAISSSH